MNKFKLRIYYEEELIARWMVDEKQKRIIEALVGNDLFMKMFILNFLKKKNVSRI